MRVAHIASAKREPFFLGKHDSVRGAHIASASIFFLGGGANMCAERT